MANYKDLLDPATGNKIDIAGLARGYVLFNNKAANDDGLVEKAIRSAAGKRSIEALEQLYGDYKQQLETGKDTQAAATLDAMAFYYLGAKMKAAQENGDVRFNLDIDVESLRRAAKGQGQKVFERSATLDATEDKAQQAEQAKAREATRMAHRTPIEEAAETLIGNHTSDDYKAVVKLATDASRDVTQNPITVLMNQDTYSQHAWGAGWRNKTAQAVIETAAEIEEARKHPAQKPAAKKEPASIIGSANAATPKSADFKASLGIENKDPIAAAAIEAKAALGLEITDKNSLAQLSAAAKGSTEDFLTAFRQLDEATKATAPGSEDRLSGEFVRNLLVRARDIYKQQQQGHTVIERADTAAELNAYSHREVTRWRGYTPAAAVPAAAAAAPDAGTASTPAPLPTGAVAIDPQIQLALEKLLAAAGDDAKALSTGGKNHKKFLSGNTAMDGWRGDKTNAAIAWFKTKHPELSGKSEEEVFAAIKAEGDKLQAPAPAKAAALADGAAAAGDTSAIKPEASAAPAPVVTIATDIKTQVAGSIAGLQNISDTEVPLDLALAMRVQNTAKTLSLKSEVQDAVVTDLMANGKSDIIRGIEIAVGLKADGKVDERLIALLSDPTAGPLIASAINAGSITAVVESTGATPPAAPNAGVGQATGR